MGSATSVNGIPDKIDLELFKTLTGVHFRQTIFDECEWMLNHTIIVDLQASIIRYR